MWQAASSVRIIVVATMLAIAGHAQIVPTKRAKEADNAAALYALAVAELDQAIKSGRLQLPKRTQPELALVNAVLIARLGFAGQQHAVGRDKTHEVAAVARSVLARSMFQQAAARPVCVFGPEFAVGRARETSLQSIIQLIGLHAQQALATQPLRTCEDACTLLRYVRHRRPGLDSQSAAVLGGDEHRALRLLHQGLQALQKDAKWPAHAARFASELDLHTKAVVDHEAYSAMFQQGIPELVELHRPRLRDMHMNVAGGFDAAKMTRRLKTLAGEVFAKPPSKNMSFAQWLRVVEERVDVALPVPAKDADVTTKATYGMAQLIMLGKSDAAKRIQETARLTEGCQQVVTQC